MWLILGARGQLGRCTQEALKERGIPHVALGSSECDITDEVAVNTVVRDSGADIVLNCAAWTAVDAAEDNVPAATHVNVEGARNVARACSSTGAVLVHISTDYVFAGGGTDPHAENSVTDPVSVYGKTKLAGEKAVFATNPGRTYVVRTAWLYSRHGSNFAKTMVRRALAGSAVRVVDDQYGQPTLADDLARHIIDLVTTPAPFGTYHGTNSGVGTWFGFATEIFGLCGVDQTLVTPVGTAEYPTRAVRPRNSALDHGRTIAAGVPEMRQWQEALRAAASDIIESIRAEAM